MHANRSKASRSGHCAMTTATEQQCRARCLAVRGCPMSKSLAVRVLPRRRASVYTNSMVRYVELSTRQATLSTQRVGATHVRDPIFLSDYSTRCYLTTGVESRTL